MKHKCKRLFKTPAAQACRVLLAYGGSFLLLASTAMAAVTDLSNIPLVSTTSTTILPNIMLIFDNSTSMNGVAMPDGASTGGYWDSPQCNGLAYDPLVTYLKPLDSTSTPIGSGSKVYSDSTNFLKVPIDGYGISSTSLKDLTGSKYYIYTTGNEKPLSFTYTYPVPPDTSANLVTDSTFYLECNSTPSSPGVTTFTPGKATIKVGSLGNTQYNITKISINNRDILTNDTGLTKKNTELAQFIYENILYDGYSATYDGNVTVTIYTDNIDDSNIKPTVTSSPNVNSKLTISKFTLAGSTTVGTVTGSGPGVGKFTEVVVGAAEQKNYANWYSYYRTRVNMSKTSIGYAFEKIRGWPLDAVSSTDDADLTHARVGLTTIAATTVSATAATLAATTTTASNTFLPIDEFNSSINTSTTIHPNINQRDKFYNSLYAIKTSGLTPLRESLSRIGRYYAGLNTDGNALVPNPPLVAPCNPTSALCNPVQVYCQKNFSILMTDGYWNSNFGINIVGDSLNTDQDGVSNVTENPVPTTSIVNPSYDSGHSAGTLSDVAYYYYHTPLRGPASTTWPYKVPPSVSDLLSKTDDVAPWQHMSTYTIGLGLNGFRAYDKDYKVETSTSAINDYYKISTGGLGWPDPIKDTAISRVDDLWHAAVSGRGKYFSAKKSKELQDSISSALGAIVGSLGSGSSAGTSSLNPTSSDDKAFVGSYSTADWSGDLKAYAVDPATGDLSATSSWSATERLKLKIPGVGQADTRTIYTGVSAFSDFKTGTFLTQTYPNQTAWSQAQIDANTKVNIVNYLRGNYDYEENRSGAIQPIYRKRVSPMGDIMGSQPVFIAKSPYTFADIGYAVFKSGNDSRAGAVYVGSNEGMLHAFNAATGDENWAYVPPMVWQNLWRLADQTYAKKHMNFVNGPLAVSEANIGGWKTVLVSAMGLGGRGYFAIDVTSPTVPKLLWNVTADATVGSSLNKASEVVNIGCTYGAPIITKLSDGTWVALATSGYNNVVGTETTACPGGPTYAGADGIGRLYVLNLADGKILKTISTGVGSTASPSGLSSIATAATNIVIDNTSTTAYGGDLLGNMWRFNLASGTASKLFAGDPSQPITTAPEIGVVNGKSVVYFGTGKYLGRTDLADTTSQAIYAIKDDGSSTIKFSEIGTKLVQQSNAGGTANALDWTSKSGWYINLPSGGTRIAVPPQLHLGTLLMAATTPPGSSNTAETVCSTGGTGYLYQINFATGGAVICPTCGSSIATLLSSPPVGLSATQLSSSTGKPPVITVIGADGSKVKIDMNVGSSTGGKAKAKRSMWRELVN